MSTIGFRHASDPVHGLALLAAKDFRIACRDLSEETDFLSYLAGYFDAAARIEPKRYREIDRNRFEKIALNRREAKAS